MTTVTTMDPLSSNSEVRRALKVCMLSKGKRASPTSTLLSARWENEKGQWVDLINVVNDVGDHCGKYSPLITDTLKYCAERFSTIE